MARFDSAARPSAWAGLSPGQNARAGKRCQGRTRKGNRYLRRVVGQWAWATRQPSTCLGRTLRRLEARLGSKTAAMAVAHKIRVIMYPLLLEGTLYEEERDDRLLPKQEERARQRALKTLERLGDAVLLDKGASPAGRHHGTASRGGLCEPSQERPPRRGEIRLDGG
jgi:transposase